MYNYPDIAQGWGEVIGHGLGRCVATKHSSRYNVPVVVIHAEQLDGLRGQIASITLERDALRLERERNDAKLDRIERLLATTLEQFSASGLREPDGGEKKNDPAPQGENCGTISEGGEVP